MKLSPDIRLDEFIHIPRFRQEYFGPLSPPTTAAPAWQSITDVLRVVNLLLSHQQFQGCTSTALMLLFKPQLSYSSSLPLSATVCQNKNQSNGTEIPEQ